MGNLAGKVSCNGWLMDNISNLTVHSNLFGRIISINYFNQFSYASLINRSNLQGASFVDLDTITIEKLNNFLSTYPNYLYAQTTQYFSGNIRSVSFMLQRSTGFVFSGYTRAYIYSVNSLGAPSTLLYTSLNTVNLDNLMNIDFFDFYFADVAVSGRITVAIGFYDYTMAVPYQSVGLICKQTVPIREYIYGEYYEKSGSAAWNNPYRGNLGLNVKIELAKKSATGSMLDRASFTPQIRIY